MVEPNEQDAVKQRIIEYARVRFFDDGFARVSVDQIATGLGMSKKTFYKYFDSKEAVVQAIVDRMLGDAQVRLQSIMENGGEFPEKLNALVRLVGNVFKTVSKNMIRDLQMHLPDVWAHIQEFRRERILTTWVMLFEEGKRTGYVRQEIDQRVFILSLYATIEGIINPTILANESFSADEALRSIVTMFMTGILTAEAAKSLQPLYHIS